MSAGWPRVALGEVLRQVTRSERVEPSKAYNLLGVRLDGGGPFLRETKLGAESAATMLNRVRAGDFIYSRLFAWRGAFGIVPPEFDGAYVSNEFPTFEVADGTVDLAFLRYWFRLPSTLARVAAESEGATPLTRNRYKESYFSGLVISLPSLAEQRRIVSRLAHVSGLTGVVAQLRAEAGRETRRALTAYYNEVTADAPHLLLGDVAPLVRRPVRVSVDGVYPELGVRSFGRGTFHKPALSGADVGTKKLFAIEPGDLLFNIVFAWEGAVAVATDEDHGRVGSHRFLTCVPDPDRALADFLWFHFTTPDGLRQLGEASPGGAGRNRTLSVAAAQQLAVPIPSRDAQQRFCDFMRGLDAVRALRDQADAELAALMPSLLDRAFAGAL